MMDEEETVVEQQWKWTGFYIDRKLVDLLSTDFCIWHIEDDFVLSKKIKDYLKKN